MGMQKQAKKNKKMVVNCIKDFEKISSREQSITQTFYFFTLMKSFNEEKHKINIDS